MSEKKTKLSPAEYLAELKDKFGETSVKAPSHRDSPDDPPLDLSDLEDAFSKLADANEEQCPPAEADHASICEGKGESGGLAEKPTGGSETPETPETPDVVRGNAHLSELFDRVTLLLGEGHLCPDEPFRPKAPESLEESGLIYDDVERLVLKYLFLRGTASGRQICAQVRLPFSIIDPVLKQLKHELFLALKDAATMGDYHFTITDRGRERARSFSKECTYFGSAPVTLRDYLDAMAAQTIAKQVATEESLRDAFSDLIINQHMLDRLGPAVNSGRGMFLFGEAGNGKTSIAERVTQAFATTIWIPRALGIDGDIIRLYDPGIHECVEEESKEGLFDLSGIDQRWVRIVRPTVVAGGELTMKELEITQNSQTKICEAPLQLKSNCGTLVIDDFGRQRMPIDELLNRWIVPLEKRYDYLNLPSGKKIQVPFDQLIIFSTNLEPKDLVDAAFLRRIPYKIEVTDPTEDEFRSLFQLMAPMLGFEYDSATVDYLIDTHYRPNDRPFRACQPRDLLLQIKNYCSYKNLPRRMSPEGFDSAVENYFAMM